MKNLAIILSAVGIAVLVPFVSYGETRDPRDASMCTMQYEPVCGKKEVQCIKAPCYPQYQTYGNSCVMANDGATFVHAGECASGGGTSGSVGGSAGGSVGVDTGGGYAPPPGCTAWFDGCNSCGMDENGNSFCTLRACVGDTPPGYCTSYDMPGSTNTVSDPDRPVSDTGSGSAGSGVQTGGTMSGSAGLTGGNSGIEPANVEADASVEANIFVRIWTSVSSWFSGLFD